MKHKSYFRVAAFSLALAIAISLWFASPVMLFYAQAQGGYGGGGVGGGGGLPAGLTYLGGRISGEGVLTQNVTAQSFDGLGRLAIDIGTRALDRWGKTIYVIFMLEMKDPLLPCAGFTVIGPVYDFGPDGATFEPALPLTFTYDPALLPEGFDEKNLVIAMWDETTGKCVILDSTVDPDTNTITTQVSHFTPFAVLAGTAPAAFTATDLTIVPSEVSIGEEVTISVLVSNTGYLSGSYKVILRINDVAAATEDITVPGLASQEVTFTIAEDVAGTYTVDVNGQTGTFEVRAAPLPPPLPPEPAPPEPTPPEPVIPPPTPTNWYLIGGSIAGLIIIGVVIWLTAVRRRAG